MPQVDGIKLALSVFSCPERSANFAGQLESSRCSTLPEYAGNGRDGEEECRPLDNLEMSLLQPPRRLASQQNEAFVIYVATAALDETTGDYTYSVETWHTYVRYGNTTRLLLWVKVSWLRPWIVPRDHKSRFFSLIEQLVR